MLNKVQNDEVSDTTKDEKRSDAGYKKFKKNTNLYKKRELR